MVTNRSLAVILLLLLLAVLLHSLYSFYHGRFLDAMVMYPLLIICYLGHLGHDKWKRKRGDDRRQ
ncbi:MAG: hypothetical protein RQ753_03395 [Desulfurivibrionaceae bacterium]|nr:hypothetical protein [Desulfobulbales bacterium]MDT8334719.1 hypothetical protein [Desulfurivibrionaceae bacterium]